MDQPALVPNIHTLLNFQALANAMETAVRENKRACARKVMIEKRKEDAERQLAMQERKEEEDRLLQARLADAAEEERRRQERCVSVNCLKSKSLAQNRRVHPSDAFADRLLHARLADAVVGSDR